MNTKYWKSKRVIFFIWLTLSITGALFITKEFRIDNSVGVWFSENDPALKKYKAYLDDWGEREWTMVMLKCDNARDPSLHPKLKSLSEKIIAHEHCHKVLSVATLPFGHPLSEKLFLRPNENNHMLMLIQTDNYFERQDPYRGKMIDALDKTLNNEIFIKEHHIVGTSVLNAQLNRAAIFDMVLFFTLVTILLTISSLILLRSIRDTIVLLSIALSTVLFTHGLIAICGYSLNIVTIMLPTILIALSTADAVHMINSFHSHRLVLSSKDAATKAVSELWLPCLGTTITTVAGFLSLADSPVLPVYQLAIFCSFGIFCAWLISISVAPIILVSLWPNNDQQPKSVNRDQWITSLFSFMISKPIMIVLTFLFFCSSLSGLHLLKADTNYVNFFQSNSQIPKSYAAVNQLGFPQSPLVLILNQTNSAEERESFIAEIENLPQVRTVVSPKPGLTELLGLVSADDAQQRIFVLTNYLGSQDLLTLVATLQKYKDLYIPETEMTITGTTMLWANMDNSVIKTQITSLIIIAPLMLIILCILFRSLFLGLLGWVLSCLPVAMIMGVMGYMGIEINIATVLIAGVTLGLAVDNAIHFIFSYKEGRIKGFNREKATMNALSGSGTRIALTSLIVMGGFACMGISSFLPTANFGVLTCLTIGVAALLDLTLLPLILKKFPDKKKTTEKITSYEGVLN